MSDDPGKTSILPNPDEITRDVSHEMRKAQQIANPSSNANQPPDSGVFEQHMVLRIEVVGSSAPLVLAPRQENVIGRRDPSGNDTPDLDLTNYAGYQMGISRRHAIIRRQERCLELVDLASRNGTFINGKKLDPDQPHLLRNGDEVRLGKMVMRLFFQAGG